MADFVDDGDGQAFAQAMEAQMAEDLARLEGVLNVVAVNVVAWLRSLTDELRPPVGARYLKARSRVTQRAEGPAMAGKAAPRATVGYREGPRERRTITQNQLQAAAKVHKDLKGKKKALVAARSKASRALIGSSGRPRPAHPGHWADVTGLLANGYGWEVRRDGEGIRVTFSNPVEYAAKLEQREGFFVLRGIADRGGVVERELVAAIAQYAPDLIVELG